ncbi:MAG: hypothetical protein AAF581_07415, partial [Planctomycetota bacterium]
TCVSNCATGDIDLSWTNPVGVTYGDIVVRRDGVAIASVGGSATTFTDLAVPSGTYVYEVIGDCDPGKAAVNCELSHDIVTLVTDPVSMQLCPGFSFNVVVVATGPDLTYQWRKDGAPIAGATNANLSLQLVSAVDVGFYDVVVSGSCGLPVTSAAAELVVLEPPTIVTQPMDQSVCAGDSAVFSVVANGTGLMYQWQRDGVDLPGETASTLTLTNVGVADADLFNVIVTGDCGSSITSDSATLTVGAPMISQQPVLPGGGACVGDAVTLEVVATGAEPLTYQWRVDGTPIAGATGSTFTIAALTEADQGEYDVVVSSQCGVQASEVVMLPNCRFRRGDCNADGQFNIGDAVCGLNFLFSSGTVTCQDAVDANDDGVVNIADPVYMLTALFGGGPQPPAPFTSCGLDPTLDNTSCATFPPCP